MRGSDVRTLAFEFALAASAFAGYRAGRSISRDAADAALRNAADVVHLEQVLGIATERTVHQWVLGNGAAVELLNRYYVVAHFPVTITFLVWVFVRHRAVYRPVRNWFVGVTACALVVHVVYPLAPPRMTAGFVDTLDVFGPRIYDDPARSVANQYAAMPSLHFGWALMVAVGVVVVRRSRRSALVVLHPVVTLLAIVATGNHYWIDAVVVTAIAAMVGSMVVASRARAVEMLPVAVSTAALSRTALRPPRPVPAVAPPAPGRTAGPGSPSVWRRSVP